MDIQEQRGRDFNRLEFIAKDVWAARTIEDKKKHMNTMIDNFEFPKKAEQFRKAVATATTAMRLDKLAGDLVLLQSGDRVIR